jgi:hypothetical protein
VHGFNQSMRLGKHFEDVPITGESPSPLHGLLKPMNRKIMPPGGASRYRRRCRTLGRLSGTRDSDAARVAVYEEVQSRLRQSCSSLQLSCRAVLL